MLEEDNVEDGNEADLFKMANAETQPDKTIRKIRRELKFATFEYDEDDKTITIETKSEEEGMHPTNGRIHLNKVYSFALLRFVIRIAQHNWFRKLKK
jgi:hypothetical protein